MDDIERTLEDIESIIIDPQFRALIDEVYDINSLMLDQPVTEREGLSILKDLNDKWRKNGYHNGRVHISGGVYVGGAPKDIEYPELEPLNLSNFTGEVMNSTEFMIRSVPRMQNGELFVEQQIVLRGFMGIPDEKGIGGISYESCAVPFMPDTVIECRDMTPQKAAAWLESYYPDTKLLIDQCIMQADDESDALMNLRDTSLPLVEGTKKDVRELKKFLQAYIEANVQFDTLIPYRAVLFGSVKIFDAVKLEWNDNNIMSEGRTLIAITNSFLKFNDELKELQMWIQGNIIKSKSDEVHFKMPLKTIESLEAGRDIYLR